MVTIQCDKCQHGQTEPEGAHNDAFYRAGWALNKGRKYEHLCNGCLPGKYKKVFKKH